MDTVTAGHLHVVCGKQRSRLHHLVHAIPTPSALLPGIHSM
jgi:hypothetical protein